MGTEVSASEEFLNTGVSVIFTIGPAAFFLLETLSKRSPALLPKLLKDTAAAGAAAVTEDSNDEKWSGSRYPVHMVQKSSPAGFTNVHAGQAFPDCSSFSLAPVYIGAERCAARRKSIPKVVGTGIKEPPNA